MMRSIRPKQQQRTGLVTTCRQRVELSLRNCGMPLLLVALVAGCESKQTATTTPVAGTQASAASDANPNTSESGNGEAIKGDVPVTATNGKVLRHAVFFTFNEDANEEDVTGVTDAFAALPGKIDSIIDFQWGVNNSPEDLNDGFTHGFLLTFKDEAGREVYLPHPAHKGEFADTLRPHLKDVFVIDYWGTSSSE